MNQWFKPGQDSLGVHVPKLHPLNIKPDNNKFIA